MVLITIKRKLLNEDKNIRLDLEQVTNVIDLRKQIENRINKTSLKVQERELDVLYYMVNDEICEIVDILDIEDIIKRKRTIITNYDIYQQKIEKEKESKTESIDQENDININNSYLHQPRAPQNNFKGDIKSLVPEISFNNNIDVYQGVPRH